MEKTNYVKFFNNGEKIILFVVDANEQEINEEIEFLTDKKGIDWEYTSEEEYSEYLEELFLPVDFYDSDICHEDLYGYDI